MSVRMPRRSELSWHWQPLHLSALLCLVVVVAALMGLGDYGAQVRDAAMGLGAAPLAPLAAWLVGIGLFALGLGAGLLGSPVLIRCWLEGWGHQLEHYRRYGRPWWKPLVAGFTREYWRSLWSMWRSYRGGATVWLSAIGVMWGSAACGGAIQYAVTKHIGAGPGIAFFGSLAGLYIPLLRLVSRLED